MSELVNKQNEDSQPRGQYHLGMNVNRNVPALASATSACEDAYMISYNMICPLITQDTLMWTAAPLTRRTCHIFNAYHVLVTESELMSDCRSRAPALNIKGVIKDKKNMATKQPWDKSGIAARLH